MQHKLTELNIEKFTKNPLTMNTTENSGLILQWLKENAHTNTDFDWDAVDFDSVDSFDSLREACEDANIIEQEIIYYSNAMEYLSKHDPSLRESFDLASDYGYDVRNLNSEKLATLHATETARQEFEELENDFTTFIEELND